MVGDSISKNLHTINIRDGPLKRVDDYKYLGSWLLNSDKDFRVRKEFAWKAAKSLYRTWKSKTISRKVKVNLFHATIESVLLYNATTWTMTKTLEKSLDGTYTKLLRYALNISWKDRIRNTEVYKNMRKISIILRERRLIFAGHCWRAKQPI